jgi:predicted nucleic acid-binding protein
MAIDSCSLRRFLDGEQGPDIVQADRAFRAREVVIPPVVITEFLSDPNLANAHRAIATQVRLLPLLPGYWERAGDLRARLLRAGRKAKLADCLVAQACIDNAVPLITYDRDFRHFEGAGLRLA